MNSHTQQTSFAVVGVKRQNFGRQVQKRVGDFAVFQNLDKPLVFHDEHSRFALGLNHG